MAVVGYARVSTTDQSLDIQLEALRAAGCERVWSERVSGSSVNGRTQLAAVLDFVRDGDTLMITRVDRLARSMGDLSDITRGLKAKGVRLKATEQPFDTGDIYGELTMNLLGCFAQLETSLRKERQMEGIAKAKAKGLYKGRPASIDLSQVRSLKADGFGPSAIAKRLRISRASVYRALEA